MKSYPHAAAVAAAQAQRQRLRATRHDPAPSNRGLPQGVVPINEWLHRRARKLIIPIVALALVPLALAGCWRISSSPTVSASDWYRFQGWGVSLAWWAEIMGGWPTADQTPIIQALFDSPSTPTASEPTVGGQQLPPLGLTILRYNLGASPTGTAANGGPAVNGVLPPRQTDCHSSYRVGTDVPTLESGPGQGALTSADPNQVNVLEAASNAITDSGETPIIQAFANSPPYWLLATPGCPQGNGSTSTVLTNSKVTEYGETVSAPVAYANYLYTEVNALLDLPINVSTVEPFNEPDLHWPNGCTSGCQEGAGFSPSATRAIMQDLCNDGLASGGLANLGVTTAEPDDNTPGDTYTYLSAPPPQAHAGKAQHGVVQPLPPCVSQIDTHGYGRTDAAENSVSKRARDLGKPLWMSEFGDHSALTVAAAVADSLDQLRPAAWVYWTAMEGPGGGSWGLLADFNLPNDATDPCISLHDAEGLPCVQPDRYVVATSRYYVMAQFSRFIRPGDKIYPVANDNNVVVSRSASGTVTVVAVAGSSTPPLSLDLHSLGVGNSTVTAYRTTEINNLRTGDGGPLERSLDLTKLTSNNGAQHISVSSSGVLTDTGAPPDSVTTYVLSQPPMNPPADAIAAWKATNGLASNRVGAAFKGVGSLLPASDTTQIAELNQLATIPLGGGLAEDPPAQVTEGEADITALDKFFGTPGLSPSTADCAGTGPTC